MSKPEFRRIPKARTGQYTVPSGTVCIQVLVPNAEDHINLLQSVVALLTDVEMWQGDDDDRTFFAGVWQEAFTETDWSNCVPLTDAWQNSEINCWVHEAQVVAGNALSLSIDTTQFHYLVGLQSAPSLNSKLRWTRYMAAGQWSLSYLYKRLTNGGVIDIYVTPPFGSTVVALNDHDTRGTTLANQFARNTFTIVESGEQTIEVEVVATSSGLNYGNTFTLLQMWRTGD